MSWYSDLKGTMKNLLGVGGPSGVNIKNNSGIVEMKNAADNAYAKLRALKIQPSATDLTDVPTLLDLKGRCAVIEFAFDGGGSVPSPGANPSKFGFVHTTGGGHTAGQVVYDDSSSLLLIPTDVVKHLTTAVACTGTISLINNGLYAFDNGSWVLKGDGNATSEGTLRAISLAYAHTDTVINSTTSINLNAQILKVINNVTTIFAGGSTPRNLLVELHGASIDTTLLATTDSDLMTAEDYVNESIVNVDGSVVQPGTVRLTVTVQTSHSAGAGKVTVLYCYPLA